MSDMDDLYQSVLRRKWCPLSQRDCIEHGCAWWTEHREVTGDGIQSEQLCAVVEISRGAEIAIDLEGE